MHFLKANFVPSRESFLSKISFFPLPQIIRGHDVLCLLLKMKRPKSFFFLHARKLWERPEISKANEKWRKGYHELLHFPCLWGIKSLPFWEHASGNTTSISFISNFKKIYMRQLNLSFFIEGPKWQQSYVYYHSNKYFYSFSFFIWKLRHGVYLKPGKKGSFLSEERKKVIKALLCNLELEVAFVKPPLLYPRRERKNKQGVEIIPGETRIYSVEKRWEFSDKGKNEIGAGVWVLRTRLRDLFERKFKVQGCKWR